MLSAEKIEEIKAQAFAGVPSELEGICHIYPLTMKEILSIGYSKYTGMLGLLLLTEQQIADIVKEKTGQNLSVEQVNPLVYLLLSTEQNDSFLFDLQKVFSTFIKENFKDFQDILRIQNKREVSAAPPKDETPGERKMRLLREKRDAVKRKQQQKGREPQSQSLVDLLEIAEVFGIDWKNETLYAFYSLIRRHQAKEKWDQDLAMICAGADSNKIKTKYWGENLNSE